MRFSEKFNLPHHHQNRYDFVNIRVDTDNRLWLDPTRIANEDREIFQRCHQIIQDFFNTIFDLYHEGNIDEARNHFGYSNESNEVFLGYSRNKPRGSGNSIESLAEVFDIIQRSGLLEDDLIRRVEDFQLFIPDFGPDSLTDLVSSLIKAELIQFTIEQCNIHNIDTNVELTTSFWNHELHCWEEITELVPGFDDTPIVLVPKDVTISNFLYEPTKYWQDAVSLWRQRVHRDQNTTLHENRSTRSPFASKKEIYKQEVTTPLKEYLVNQTRDNTELIINFRNNVSNTQRGTNSNKLTDDELEEFVLSSY